jgi:hypothetical protein
MHIENIVGCIIVNCQNYQQIDYEGLFGGTLNPKVDIHTNQLI